jgi:ADP-heptose:LPS heptosyltransferase
MKFLIISLAGIGDTLSATPMIRRLKEKFPESKIDVLVMWAGSKQILENNPNINRVYFFNMLKEGPLKSALFCLRLRRKGYDISINSFPQSKIIYRAVSFLIGAKKRISHRYENYGLIDKILINSSIRQDYEIHAIQNNIKLLSPLGIADTDPTTYELFLSRADLRKAHEFLTSNKIQSKEILLGISIGTGKTKNLALRRWPIEHYRDLIRLALDYEKNLRVLIFGGPEEKELNEWLISEIKDSRMILVNSGTITEAAAVLKNCQIFVSVDNVFMHLASALGVKKQIVINTPTINKTVLPFRNDFVLVGNKLPRGMGYKYNGKGIYGKKEEIIRYMKNISPDSVFRELVKVL